MILKKEQEIEKLEENLSMEDFDTGWECALYVRQQIVDGHLENHIKEGYMWAVKNCTIKGKKIKHWTKLKKDYEGDGFG